MRNFLLCLLATSPLYLSAQAVDDYWRIGPAQRSITWDLTAEQRLPHGDNLEMAGRRVATIIDYEVDAAGYLTLSRDVIFPQLRTYTRTDEPDWKKYRAYYRHTFGDELLPTLTTGERRLQPGPLDSVVIDGTLRFYHRPAAGVAVVRTLLPSMTQRAVVEIFELTNTTDSTIRVRVGEVDYRRGSTGYKGSYGVQVRHDAPSTIVLTPGERYDYAVYFTATLNDESLAKLHRREVLEERSAFLLEMERKLVLTTPDPVLNTLFYFSKIRNSESIYESTLGLIHSPGGGNYYVGTWANDQVEYNGPFFPFLGYATGNEAAYNTYKWFLENIPTDPDRHIPYSVEVDGNFVMQHVDRGDAAMIAYGTAQYLLARADKGEAKELWPLVEWCLDYCHRKRNAAGAVLSESDEMEGRIPTGDANLATSSLYYGGLKFGARLADELGMGARAAQYRERAKEMEAVIENYFGAEMSGLATYRYFDGNENLRHWICLPLVMGIDTRREATLEALFGKLWTKDGILVELKPTPDGEPLFWDRGTLYAFRGAFKAGATALGLDRLQSYSRTRLLGSRVPYVVEAYPENGMRHLSAESGLYCRVFIEGIFGIEQQGFRAFSLRPRLPEAWPGMRLRQMQAFGATHDISVVREGKQLRVRIERNGTELLNQRIEPGERIVVRE